MNLKEIIDKNIEHIYNHKLDLRYPDDLGNQLRKLLRGAYLQGVYDAHHFYTKGKGLR